jgi:hypothetical protein
MMSAREISSSRRSPPESTLVLVEDPLRRLLGLLRAVLQVASHPQVLLDGHIGEHRLVLKNVGDPRRFQLGAGAKPGDVERVGPDAGGDAPVIDGGEERLAPPDLEGEVVQDLHLAVTGPQVIDGQIGIAAGQRRELIGPRRVLGDLLGLPGDLLDRDHAIDTAQTIAAHPPRCGAFPGRALAALGHQCAPR